MDLFTYLYRITGDDILQYKENCEALLDDPTIGGENIKYYVHKAIRNLLHANIDVYSRRLFSEFPGDGVKYISNFNHNVKTRLFPTKVGIINFSIKLHIN